LAEEGIRKVNSCHVLLDTVEVEGNVMITVVADGVDTGEATMTVTEIAATEGTEGTVAIVVSIVAEEEVVIAVVSVIVEVTEIEVVTVEGEEDSVVIVEATVVDDTVELDIVEASVVVMVKVPLAPMDLLEISQLVRRPALHLAVLLVGFKAVLAVERIMFLLEVVLHPVSLL
jgi:hypothetical protein